MDARGLRDVDRPGGAASKGCRMRWMEISVVLEGADPLAAQELVADLFYQRQVKGVVLEEPGTTGTLRELPDGTWPLSQGYSVTGYLHEDDALAGLLEQFDQDVARLARQENVRYRILTSFRCEEQWAEAWKEHFHPVNVTPRLVVAPTWEPYQAGEEEIVIRIDPGMAFGTGAHPTTRLCMALMEKYLRPGSSVLDVGTGSGILMITAFRLGAAWLRGVDNDPMAVEIAGRNLLANAVPETAFALLISDLGDALRGHRFDMVIANLTTEPVCALAARLPGLLAPGGAFIASGIVEAKLPHVRNHLDAVGFEVKETRTEEGWTALAASHTRGAHEP